MRDPTPTPPAEPRLVILHGRRWCECASGSLCTVELRPGENTIYVADGSSKENIIHGMFGALVEWQRLTSTPPGTG